MADDPSAPPKADRPLFKVPKSYFGLQPVIRVIEALTCDWTPLLNLMVIAAALLLGWMLGRAGVGRTAVVAKIKSGTPPVAQTSTARPLRTTSNVDAPVGQSAGPDRSVAAPVPSAADAISNTKNAPTRAIAPPRASKAKRTSDETSADGLVVYQKGKVIFQMRPVQPSGESAKDPAAKTSGQAASHD